MIIKVFKMVGGEEVVTEISQKIIDEGKTLFIRPRVLVPMQNASGEINTLMMAWLLCNKDGSILVDNETILGKVLDEDIPKVLMDQYSESVSGFKLAQAMPVA